MTKMKYGMLAAAMTLMISGCSAPASDNEPIAAEPPAQESEAQTPGAEASACDTAFAEAASVSDMEDQLSDLWPAFTACGTLEEFIAASENHPDALDGADPEIYATNQCLYEPVVEDSPICAEIGS